MLASSLALVFSCVVSLVSTSASPPRRLLVPSTPRPYRANHVHLGRKGMSAGAMAGTIRIHNLRTLAPTMSDEPNLAKLPLDQRQQTESPTEPNINPYAKPQQSQDEPFDPRIIVYVSLPALVLAAQLFFTFSRDALTGDAVGPAVMDLLL